MSFINLPPLILRRPLTFHLAPIVGLSDVKLLSLVVFSSLPSMLGLSQFLHCDILVDLTLECQQSFKDILGEGVKQLS